MKNSIFTAAYAIVLVLALLCIVAIASADEPKTDYMILVNKQHLLPDNWPETVELETARNSFDDREFLVEKEALKAFNALRDELLSEGIDIELDSTYRTVEYQQELMERFKKEYGEEYALATVATPGASEHHTGLAIDICLIKDGVVIDENEDMIAEREIFAKIHEKLPKYGFILRYPEGSEEITGYGFEPWHFRFINDVEVATEIFVENITFEEYLSGDY